MQNFKKVFLNGTIVLFLVVCSGLGQIGPGDSAYDNFVCYRFERKSEADQVAVIKDYATKIKERFFKSSRLKPSQEAERIKKRDCLKNHPEFLVVLAVELQKWVRTLDEASLSPTSFISLGQRDELSLVSARLNLLVLIILEGVENEN